MITKTKLNDLRHVQDHIRFIEMKIESLRAQMVSISAKVNDIPVQSTRRDILAQQIAQLDEWQRELDAEYLDIIQSQREAKREIQKLPVKYQDVLSARYLDGLSWQKVAEKVGYSERQCRRLHLKAIKEGWI